MDVSEVNEVLRNVSYKPEYELVWQFTGSPTFVRIWWRYRRPDVHTHEEDTGESGFIWLNLFEIRDPEHLLRAVFGMTLRLEEHEAREWLQYNGERPFNPHTRLLPEPAAEPANDLASPWSAPT